MTVSRPRGGMILLLAALLAGTNVCVESLEYGLARKRINKKDAIISIRDEDDYKTIVKAKDKDYSLMLFLWLDNKNKAEFKEFKSLARAYREEWRKLKKTAQTEGNSFSFVDPKLLFVSVALSATKAPFYEVAANVAPVYVIVNDHSADLQQIKQGKLSLPQLAQHVYDLSGIDLPFYNDVSAGLSAHMSIALLFAMSAVAVSTCFRRGVLSILQSRTLWMLITLTIFALGISGMVYCIIRKPGLTRMARDGVGFVSPAQRSQLVLEGLGFGVINMAVAGCVIFLVSIPSIEWLGWKATDGSKGISTTLKLFKRGIVFLLVACAIAACVQLLLMDLAYYQGKVQWYNVASEEWAHVKYMNGETISRFCRSWLLWSKKWILRYLKALAA